MYQKSRAVLRSGIILLIIAVAGYISVRAIDPPWHIDEIQGSIVSWGQVDSPKLPVKYYKMVLSVKTDDERSVSVSSERRERPTKGERVRMQERVGWLGTRSFVEIPQPQLK